MIPTILHMFEIKNAHCLESKKLNNLVRCINNKAGHMRESSGHIST